MGERNCVTRPKWHFYWNVIVTGDKGSRWGYFDQIGIALLLREEHTSTEKTFWSEVGWRQTRRGHDGEQLRQLQTGKQVNSVRAFYNQMLECGVNVIPPVMAITFIVIIRQTQNTGLLSFTCTPPSTSSYKLVHYVYSGIDSKSLHTLLSLSLSLSVCLFSWLMPSPSPLHLPLSLLPSQSNITTASITFAWFTAKGKHTNHAAKLLGNAENVWPNSKRSHFFHLRHK